MIHSLMACESAHCMTDNRRSGFFGLTHLHFIKQKH